MTTSCRFQQLLFVKCRFHPLHPLLCSYQQRPVFLFQAVRLPSTHKSYCFDCLLATRSLEPNADCCWLLPGAGKIRDSLGRTQMRLKLYKQYCWGWKRRNVRGQCRGHLGLFRARRHSVFNIVQTKLSSRKILHNLIVMVLTIYLVECRRSRNESGSTGVSLPWDYSWASIARADTLLFSIMLNMASQMIPVQEKSLYISTINWIGLPPLANQVSCSWSLCERLNKLNGSVLYCLRLLQS